MITARQAYDRVNEQIKEQLDVEFENICSKINEQISKNSYDVIIPKIMSGNKEKLHNLGYKVTEFQSGINENAVQISWDITKYE